MHGPDSTHCQTNLFGCGLRGPAPQGLWLNWNRTETRAQQPVACSDKASFEGIYRPSPGVYTQTSGATPRKDSRILDSRPRVNGKSGLVVSWFLSHGCQEPSCTPGMAANVSGTLWTLREFVEKASRSDRMTPESTTLALWIAWLVSWGIAAFWSNRTEKGAGIAAEIVFRILFWASATLLLAPSSDLRGYAQVQFWHLNAALKWISVALTASGFLFAWWARIHLGGLWSDWVTKKAGHHVVDTGPYRLVRHPIYLGLIFAAFATAPEKGTSFALLGAAILTFSFYTKARREERFLRVELGENAYEAYARKTAMLVPFTGRPRN